MSHRLFICISTGQNIANVAPLLAVAKAGERILFLSSPFARDRQWTAPALEVLDGHNLAAEDFAVAGDEPESFAATLTQLPALAAAGDIVFVANGGSKLQALAVYDALRRQASAAGKPLSLLYSDDSTVRLSWFGQSLEAAATRRPYPDTPLGLNDVLRLRRKIVAAAPDAAGKLLYAAGDLTDAGRHYAGLPPGYGEDATQTRETHVSAASRAAFMATFSKAELPRWKQVEQIHPEGAERVRRVMAQALGSPDIGDARLENLSNCVIKCVGEAIDRHQRQAFPPPEFAGDGLGQRFEGAILERLCRWLQQHRPRHVQSVHANVKIAHANKPGIVMLEADVLLLLKNGLLIMIEAKSHTAEFKDLDARIVNLRRSASELAKLWVCSPLYTTFADENWFAVQHDFAARVKTHGLEHIPFTLPDQPLGYEWPRRPSAGTDAGAECAASRATQTYRVESFETVLSRLLMSFAA